MSKWKMPTGYKKFNWSDHPEIVSHVEQNYRKMTDEQLFIDVRRMAEDKIGAEAMSAYRLTKSALSSFRKRRNWLAAAPGSVLWSDEMKAFVKKWFRRKSDIWLANAFNEKFPRYDGRLWKANMIAGHMTARNMNRTPAQIKKIKRQNWDLGLVKRTRKYDGKPIGSELTVNKQDGSGVKKRHHPEIYIKTESGWRLKKHVVWEQLNGPIPAAHQIKMKDGDTLNVNIENMEMVPIVKALKEMQEAMTDNFVAGIIAVGNPELRESLKIHGKATLELARANMALKRKLKKGK